MAGKRAVVIGAGPGGYVCAIRLAQLGIQTTIIERQYIGGVCLNVGCIPSKALIASANLWQTIKGKRAETLGIYAESAKFDWNAIMQHKQQSVEKLTSGVEKLLKGNGVEIVRGSARFTSANQIAVSSTDEEDLVIDFDYAVIATGSRPIELSSFPFSHPAVCTSTDALSFDAPPNSMMVIGGGVIGIELGSVYAAFGTELYIVEATESILPGIEKEAVRFVSRGLRQLGAKVHTSSIAEGFVENSDGTLTVSIKNDKGRIQEITVEKILVSVGRVPNTQNLGLEDAGVQTTERGFVKVDDKFQSSAPGIYAIGDITEGPLLAHRASAQGEAVAAFIAERDELAPDTSTIPAVAFTMPEIATVGLTQQQAEDAGIQTKVGKFSFGANGKALAEVADTGFVKIVARENDSVIIGATVVGHGADALIGELAVAVRNQLTLQQIEHTVHPHPTLSETVMEAAFVADEMPIHMMLPKRKNRQ